MAGNFELQNLLGSGTFGEAWVARNKTDNSKCVVKVIKIHRLSEKELDQALTEVSVLARCNHVNIIKYQDAFVDGGSLNIVMEYADGGDLHKKIVNQKGIHFGKEVILDLFVQMCFALKYIHSQNILHRDLKTQNIFLTSQNIVKLGDFGIARVLRDSADCALTTIGTPFYLSPEICQKKPYNHKSDMWALGCVLYEMCTLHVPFNAKDFDSLVMKIMTGQFEPLPSHFGTTIRYLCTRLLDKDPNKRLSANETLNFSPLKTFVQRYEPKRQIPQLSVRRYSSNAEEKSIRRNSVSSGVKKDSKNQLKGPIKPVDHSIKGKPGNVSRKQSDPLRQLQYQEKVTRRPSIRAEYPSPKKKGIDWMSDKENIDPRRLIGNKTYQVKYPKFRRLSSATPRIKRIVSQQRASLSTEEQCKEECARTVLYRNIEKQSVQTPVPVKGSGREHETIETDDSVCDDVFGSVDNTQLSFDEYLQMSKENSRRVSIEGSKRHSIDSKFQESIENIRRSSIESSNKALDNCRTASVRNNRRHSVGSKKPSDVRRTSVESRKGSAEINDNYKNNGRRSSVETGQKTNIDNKIQRSVNIKRRSGVEKNSRKVSVSDGCLYTGSSVQENKVIRRSSSYDAISSNKMEESKVHKAGSETYLVTAPQSDQVSDVKETSSKDNEMIKYINKALYMSLQDFMQSPATAKTKTFKRLSDIFGEEKLDDILEVCRECLYNHDNYDTFHTMLSETDVLCLPLIFQYLQLEGSQ